MFHKFSYHVLESLVPPSPGVEMAVQQSLLRLENICAASIAKDVTNINTISQIPAHLHKVVWVAYLRDKYYAHDLSLDGIPELLYHWPREEFILKDLMPSFPPRLDAFEAVRENPAVWDHSKYGPYYENKFRLEEFYSMVLNYIVGTFTREFTDSASYWRKNYCKIKKIDISGYLKTNNDIIKMIEINYPFLRNSIGQLEIVLDVHIFMNGELSHDPYIEELLLTTHTYSNSFNSIILKFNHVTVGSYKGGRDVTGIIESLVTNGPISIELSGYLGVSVLLENILKNNIPQDHILAVTLLDSGITFSFPMTFLQYVKNLVHLDLQQINLHGKLNFLRHMHRGLLYLNLNNCKLTNSDLGQLLETSHQSTLKELNLNRNKFSYDARSTNLIDLCKNLTNILQLDIESDGLETWPSKVLELLCYSFKSMPKVLKLNLCRTKFSVNDIKIHIMLLKENHSLRYLSLAFPQNTLAAIGCTTETDGKLFCAEINELINENRSQLLYVDFSNIVY